MQNKYAHTKDVIAPDIEFKLEIHCKSKDLNEKKRQHQKYAYLTNLLRAY